MSPFSDFVSIRHLYDVEGMTEAKLIIALAQRQNFVTVCDFLAVLCRFVTVCDRFWLGRVPGVGWRRLKFLSEL